MNRLGAPPLLSFALLSAALSGCSAQKCQCSSPLGAPPTTSAAATSAVDASGSVCRFSTPLTARAPEKDGRVFIPPAHPALVYTGRVDCKPDAVTFGFPGAAIRARFRGPSLELLYEDNGGGDESSTNYFNVIIDDRAPALLALDPKRKAYVLAEDLGPGEHSVELFKRTESSQRGKAGIGQGKFLGFRLGKGGALAKVTPRPHRVEFIGDSITCGYGADLSTEQPDNFAYSSRNANAYASWGAVAARALDAELMLVAYSGRGVYRNYGSAPGEVVPELYLRALPDDESSFWDFRSFQPEVVVINLGTNDFSPGGVDRRRFREAYVRFLASLRLRYADIPLIVAIGPMLSDHFPPGEHAFSNIKADAASIREERRKAGDANVHLLTFEPQEAPFGEDWHPTAAEHERMAKRVTELIQSLLHW